MCLRTYLETGCHDLVGIQQRVSQQDGTFAFQCFLGIGDSLFVTVIDAFETFLFEPYQFRSASVRIWRRRSFLLFHIGESNLTASTFSIPNRSEACTAPVLSQPVRDICVSVY